MSPSLKLAVVQELIGMVLNVLPVTQTVPIVL
jgi:hypothetical protein